MNEPVASRVERLVASVASQYHRLVIVVGPHRSGKTTTLRERAEARAWPFVNLNLELSERLLPLTARQRPLRAAAVMGDLVREQAAGEVVLLDNIEPLFKNSARGKTVSVLAHVWGNVPPNAQSLHQRACASLASCPPGERLALHWAMMVGTYPVFSDVASAIGRLTALQGNFSLEHLTRRLSSSWGQRSTFARATQRIVRSMVHWGALVDLSRRGHYEATGTAIRVGTNSGLLLLEAILLDAEASSISLDQLLRHPALFPFTLLIGATDLRGASQFTVHREGLDVDLVELRKPSVS